MSLQRFQLDGIRDTDSEIGRGAYAVVKELFFREHKCVGKELHTLNYESATPDEKAIMLQKFEEECELLSQLHHPNIVEFLGVYSGTSSGLPSLVMEYLPNGNLSGYLQRHGVLPAATSISILRDVALGLRYLHEHSPPIVHRDLTANNVLLTTSMSAKISDLGEAKILSKSAALMTQTPVPGTVVYMPPEAMVAHPKYTYKIDIFSMGVLIVHVLSGEWPIPSEAFTEDPCDSRKIIPVIEFDRRCGTIEKIKDRHLFLDLIQQCLNNIPDRRPDAVQVIYQLSKIPNSGYYDFLLIGKTGMGKSSLGNKLLQWEQVDSSMIRRLTPAAVGFLTGASSPKIRFITANDLPPENIDERVQPITQMCELLANDKTKIQVLDTPGLSDFSTFSQATGMSPSLYEGNLQIMHQIAQVQSKENLQVKRVVYFLPVRGVLERVDRILQEELKVLHDFFGLNIFNYMVVIATNHPSEQYQRLGYGEEQLEQMKKVFHLALKCVTGVESILCPPIVYIGINECDVDVMEKLKGAQVLKGVF